MPHGLSKEGGGGSPHPVPSQSILGPLSHWSLPSHVTLLFLYKKPIVPLLVAYTLMDDPEISPEAQQVILSPHGSIQTMCASPEAQQAILSPHGSIQTMCGL